VPIYALGDQVPDIHPDAYISPEAVIIGSVILGSQASVWPCAVLRGDDASITIGARTSVQDGTVIHTVPYRPTTIGADCAIGHNVHIEGAIVEDHALIGSGSVLLRATVRSGGVVAAGAVVTNGMDVPAGMMAAGIPAVLRPVKDPRLALNVNAYIARGKRFREELRRID
jgi:carbonic anhydrase/acetyltransferase-like protein (isoleucine patch superfamily)